MYAAILVLITSVLGSPATGKILSVCPWCMHGLVATHFSRVTYNRSE